MPTDPNKIVRFLRDALVLIVLLALAVMSLIVQVRDADMDAISVRERHALSLRLDAAEVERRQLRERMEALEKGATGGKGVPSH